MFWQLHSQDFGYLYDTSNETAGAFVPAQILYDAFHGRYQSGTGAIILLFVIWGSFFFGGLSITTSAARVVSSLSFAPISLWGGSSFVIDNILND